MQVVAYLKKIIKKQNKLYHILYYQNNNVMMNGYLRLCNGLTRNRLKHFVSCVVYTTRVLHTNGTYKNLVIIFSVCLSVCLSLFYQGFRLFVNRAVVKILYKHKVPYMMHANQSTVQWPEYGTEVDYIPASYYMYTV